MRVLAFCINKIEQSYAQRIESSIGDEIDFVIGGPAIGPAFDWQTAKPRPMSPLRRIVFSIIGWSSQLAVSLRDSTNPILRLAIATIYCLPFRVVYRYIKIKYHIESTIRMLKGVKPVVIILFEDNIENLTNQVAIAAVRLGIPYLVLPTSIPNPREPAAFYRHSRRHAAEGPLRSFLAKCWPQWVYRFEGHPMFRLPPEHIIALSMLGIDAASPWILNSGNSAAICVESRATEAIYRNLGVAAEQLAIIGSPIDDRLYEVDAQRDQRRRELFADLEVRPLVLVAFPPDQYSSPSTKDFEYPSFSELVSGWAAALAPLIGKVNVLVKPHPRLDAEKLSALAQVGCRIVTQPTEDLVPLADIYVASISATIRWALALGLPVINYDCYRYRYHDFDSAAGLVAIEDGASFEEAISVLCTDDAYRAASAERQKQDASKWGIIDGQFIERLLATIRKAATRPPEPVSDIAG